MDRDCISPVKIDLLPKNEMVRMVHVNTFGRMDLEHMSPKTKTYTNTCFFIAMSKMLEQCILGSKKAPGGCPTNNKKLLNTFWTIPEPIWAKCNTEHTMLSTGNDSCAWNPNTVFLSKLSHLAWAPRLRHPATRAKLGIQAPVSRLRHLATRAHLAIQA